MIATDKTADNLFFSAMTLSFLLFLAEIITTTVVMDDFKYSFFFWLDIVAALSLTVDIMWLVAGLETMMNMKTTLNQADVTPGEVAVASDNSDKISKIIKSLRLIRLIRIIKLYKYVV